MRGGRALFVAGDFFNGDGRRRGIAFCRINRDSGGESWVAFSVLAAGVLVWRNTPMSSALAVALVAVFALGHGYVHAADLADGADALGYSAGFLLTTALLHGLGIAIGLSGMAGLKIIGTVFGLLCAVVGVGLLAGA